MGAVFKARIIRAHMADGKLWSIGIIRIRIRVRIRHKAGLAVCSGSQHLLHIVAVAICEPYREVIAVILAICKIAFRTQVGECSISVEGERVIIDHPVAVFILLACEGHAVYFNCQQCAITICPLNELTKIACDVGKAFICVGIDRVHLACKIKRRIVFYGYIDLASIRIFGIACVLQGKAEVVHIGRVLIAEIGIRAAVGIDLVLVVILGLGEGIAHVDHAGCRIGRHASDLHVAKAFVAVDLAEAGEIIAQISAGENLAICAKQCALCSEIEGNRALAAAYGHFQRLAIHVDAKAAVGNRALAAAWLCAGMGAVFKARIIRAHMADGKLWSIGIIRIRIRVRIRHKAGLAVCSGSQHLLHIVAVAICEPYREVIAVILAICKIAFRTQVGECSISVEGERVIIDHPVAVFILLACEGHAVYFNCQQCAITICPLNELTKIACDVGKAFICVGIDRVHLACKIKRRIVFYGYIDLASIRIFGIACVLQGKAEVVHIGRVLIAEIGIRAAVGIDLVLVVILGLGEFIFYCKLVGGCIGVDILDQHFAIAIIAGNRTNMFLKPGGRILYNASICAIQQLAFFVKV